ncbi:MAG TPA: DUF3300 domain-containing protein [Tepidisphaeraceae bacterium]|nr:DUF3300 domain-containing protein [Tepidisphaeraceae bacterium]
MKSSVMHSFRRVAGRTFAVGVVATLLAGTVGCVVHEGYYGRPYVRRSYYYGPDGRVYVRETVVEPPPTVVVTAPPPGAPAPAVVAPAETPATTALQPLVAPIALYPDPLLAVLLPATTFPQQVQDAGTWLAANPNPTNEMIDAQPWEPSVKAVVHYPTVMTQLTGDMQWTQSLGSAYASQPADVMAAIQQMRAQAVAQGNLVTTAQETVVQDGGVIAIEPPNDQVIYVPTYDPVQVYVGYHPLYWGTVGYSVGPWFGYGFDWGGGVLFVGDWHGAYYYRGGHWGRDFAWRDHYAHYERPARFGPPPHIDRAHYALAAGVRGREADIHRTMVEHAAERHNVQRGAVAGQRGAVSGQRGAPSRQGGGEHAGARPEERR